MPRVFVLALDNWLGASRMPKALRNAGFDVSLLCYPNTLIALTKYVDDRALCKPEDDAMAVARRIMRLLEGKPAKLMIPVDDRAQRYMRHVVEVTSTGYLPTMLTDLVAKSLPRPEVFELGADKIAASDFMDGLGFRTPPRALLRSRDDLAAAARELGFPLVVKPLDKTAGEGVQRIDSIEGLDKAVLDDGRWMAQRYIRGKAAACASVALDGRFLAAIPYEKTLTHPGETGPASVVTRLDSEEMVRGSQAFAEASGATGFFSLGYVIDEKTGQPYFLECNARAVPVVPSSATLGLDLCRALFAGLAGIEPPRQDPDAPKVLALYPQELHRDPNSEFRDLILDEPTDDLLLHKAMQKGIEMLASGAL